MDLLVAIVFVCNLQFKACKYTVHPEPFTDSSACLTQLLKDVAEANARRPDMLGDAEYPRFWVFGQCRPRLGLRIKVDGLDWYEDDDFDL